VDPQGLWGVGANAGGTAEVGAGIGIAAQANSGVGVFGGSVALTFKKRNRLCSALFKIGAEPCLIRNECDFH